MKCKFCKEDIIDGAIKCKHCGSMQDVESKSNKEESKDEPTDTVKCKYCGELIPEFSFWCKHCKKIYWRRTLYGLLFTLFALSIINTYFIKGNDDSIKNNVNANSLVTAEYLNWELEVEKNSKKIPCSLHLKSKKFGQFNIYPIFSSDYWTVGYSTFNNKPKLKDKKGVVSFTIDNKVVETIQLRYYDNGDGIAHSSSKPLSNDITINLLNGLVNGTTLKIHGSAFHNSFFVDLSDFKQYLKKYDSCLNTYFKNDEVMIQSLMSDHRDNYGELRFMKYISSLRGNL